MGKPCIYANYSRCNGYFWEEIIIGSEAIRIIQQVKQTILSFSNLTFLISVFIFSLVPCISTATEKKSLLRWEVKPGIIRILTSSIDKCSLDPCLDHALNQQNSGGVISYQLNCTRFESRKRRSWVAVKNPLLLGLWTRTPLEYPAKTLMYWFLLIYEVLKNAFQNVSKHKGG